MALHPDFAAHHLVFPGSVSSQAAGVPVAKHTVEVYLDYTCQYAKRTFETLTTTVIPAVRTDVTLAPALRIIFRQQVQSWHSGSAPAHEAALAVARVAPERFWDFSAALFAAQRDFYDGRVVAEPGYQTYQRLTRVATGAGIDGNAVLELLSVSEAPEHHAGNEVSKDLKKTIKMARLAGIHFTPTVVLDGLVQSQISSSWTGEQWIKWLEGIVENDEM